MRLIIVLAALAICSPVSAQRLEPFAGEQLVYQLDWTVNLLPFGGVKAGEACLSCQPAKTGGYFLNFHGFSKGLAKKLYQLDNRATVFVDNNGLVQTISHYFSNQAEEKWQADYCNQLIYHSLGKKVADTLEMSGYQLRDALSSIYLLRQARLRLGDTLRLPIVSYDPVKRVSSWKQVRLMVLGKARLKVQGEFVNCWQLEIKLDPGDNLFPGGNIKLSITADSRLTPVLVESDLYFWGFMPSKVTGRLITPIKKDGP